MEKENRTSKDLSETNDKIIPLIPLTHEQINKEDPNAKPLSLNMEISDKKLELIQKNKDTLSKIDKRKKKNNTLLKISAAMLTVLAVTITACAFAGLVSPAMAMLVPCFGVTMGLFVATKSIMDNVDAISSQSVETLIDTQIVLDDAQVATKYLREASENLDPKTINAVNNVISTVNAAQGAKDNLQGYAVGAKENAVYIKDRILQTPINLFNKVSDMVKNWGSKPNNEEQHNNPRRTLSSVSTQSDADSDVFYDASSTVGENPLETQVVNTTVKTMVSAVDLSQSLNHNRDSTIINDPNTTQVFPPILKGK